MVARRSLEAKIGVRIPVPQQSFAKATELPAGLEEGYGGAEIGVLEF